MSGLARYQAPVAAGIAFAAYGVFGAIPIVLGLGRQLGLDERTTTDWVWTVAVTSGLTTIPLAVITREPLPMGFNIPAAVLMGSAAARYGWEALLGACLVTGIVIALSALAGVGRASMRYLPLPIVMGMFAGSILRLATNAFAQITGEDPLIAIAAIGGYFATRVLSRDRVPATAGALAVAIAATIALGRMPADVPLVVSGPHLATVAFDAGAVVTLVVPILLLVVGTGNVQSLGYLRTQGYRTGADLLTFIVGGLTVVNALLGASPSGLARVGAAIVGGPEAGRKEVRWVASVVSSIVFIAVGLLAVTVTDLSYGLPIALVTSVAGLAIVGALLDALRIVFTSKLMYSSFFAFLVAFTPFAPLGLESAFWSLVAGMGLAVVFERAALREAIGSGDRERTDA